MGKTGRLYSPEFKEEAIRLVHSCEEKYPVAKIARSAFFLPLFTHLPRATILGSSPRQF